MDFEKAYQNFLNGTATEEEIEFVRSEIKKAQALNDIIDNAKGESVVKKADKNEVKRAIKSFNLRDTVKTLIIVFSSLLLVSAITFLAIFIPIYNTAKDNLNVTAAEAKEIATQYMVEKTGIAREDVVIRDFDRDLEVEGRIKNARFIYTMDVYNGYDNSYEIEIDGKTGKILEADKD